LLFLHLLIQANHAPKKFHGLTIKRGEVLTGRKALATQTCLTEQEIRTALKKLQSTSNLTIKSTNKYSIISICNYDKFQGTSTSKSTNKLTNEQPQTRRLKNIKKEYSRFTPPTMQEVVDYCLDRKNGIDAEYFIDYYQARGWKLKGGQPVKDWKACVRTWEGNTINASSQNKRKPTRQKGVSSDHFLAREYYLATGVKMDTGTQVDWDLEKL